MGKFAKALYSTGFAIVYGFIGMWGGWVFGGFTDVFIRTDRRDLLATTIGISVGGLVGIVYGAIDGLKAYESKQAAKKYENENPSRYRPNCLCPRQDERDE